MVALDDEPSEGTLMCAKLLADLQSDRAPEQGCELPLPASTSCGLVVPVHSAASMVRLPQSPASMMTSSLVSSKRWPVSVTLQ